VLGSVAGDQVDQVGVQGQVAVFVELADRDVQPVGLADQDDRVGGQRGVLPDAQPGAQQELHGDADEHPLVGLRGGEQPGCGLVVEGLGQGVVLLGYVTEEHRHPHRGLLPAPLVDAQEEHP